MGTPWQDVNRVMAEAEIIEKLIQLYRERGITWDEARRLALEKYRERQTTTGDTR